MRNDKYKNRKSNLNLVSIVSLKDKLEFEKINEVRIELLSEREYLNFLEEVKDKKKIIMGVDKR